MELPTPPDAPIINIFSPGPKRPGLRRARRGVSTDKPTTQTRSKAVFTGLRATLFSQATGYSTKAPSPPTGTDLHSQRLRSLDLTSDRGRQVACGEAVPTVWRDGPVRSGR